jgi:preprotein translocase subunit YajC
MLYALLLLANAADKGEKGEGPPGSAFLIPIVLMVVAFYFLIILPGRKERQQRQSLINALKKNDKVITNGGIIGVVVGLKEGSDEVTIRSEEAKLLILRGSIARIVTEPDKDAAAQTKPTT